MPNPQNIVNYKFKKGQSGNPAGRPKLPDLTEALKAILGEQKDGKSALDAILAALRAKAAKGDVRAAELLLDRGYGKVKQVNELQGKDGESLIQPLSDIQVNKIITTLRNK